MLLRLPVQLLDSESRNHLTMSTVSVQSSNVGMNSAEKTWRRMEKTAFSTPTTTSSSSSPSSSNVLRDSQAQAQPDFIPLISAESTDGSINSGIPQAKRKKLISGENILNCTPWRKRDYTCDPTGLHDEIIDFYEYMKPRPSEKRMRMEVVDRVRHVIHSRWPRAQVLVFGSFCTGLYLPTGDIDIVVFGEWPKLPLFSLEEEFRKADIASEESLLVLDKTAVPIIKFIDKITEVKVDISFNQHAGVQCVELIQGFIQEFPYLPHLAFVIKQFLAQRQLNEVYYGGISSYSLILMIVSFFQRHPRYKTSDPSANLGVLLIEFFELYGRHLNYLQVGISVVDGGCYFPKDSAPGSNGASDNGLLFIQDPLNRQENASRGCYGYLQVKQAFEHAFNRLHVAVLQREQGSLTTPSLLSLIVQVSEEVDEYRNWIDSTWLAPSPSSSVFPVGLMAPHSTAMSYSSPVARHHPVDPASGKGGVQRPNGAAPSYQYSSQSAQ